MKDGMQIPILEEFHTVWGDFDVKSHDKDFTVAASSYLQNAMKLAVVTVTQTLKPKKENYMALCRLIA